MVNATQSGAHRGSSNHGGGGEIGRCPQTLACIVRGAEGVVSPKKKHLPSPIPIAADASRSGWGALRVQQYQQAAGQRCKLIT